MNIVKNTNASADLIFINGKIVTVNAASDICSALAIAGERIIAVGSDTEVRATARDDDKILCAVGHTR